MYVTQDIRIIYWDHYLSTSHKRERPKGVTDKRLEKIKEFILANDLFWQESYRHGINGFTPIDFHKYRPASYLHLKSNFWSMIREIMVEQGIIKLKCTT